MRIILEGTSKELENFFYGTEILEEVCEKEIKNPVKPKAPVNEKEISDKKVEDIIAKFFVGE